jgi:hypothetical protein
MMQDKTTRPDDPTTTNTPTTSGTDPFECWWLYHGGRSGGFTNAQRTCTCGHVFEGHRLEIPNDCVTVDNIDGCECSAYWPQAPS